MSKAPDNSPAIIECRSLEVGKWGNLFMAIAGIAAAYMSRSDALLIDGLYSGINFVSAMIAAGVSAAVLRPPDRRYPFGYAAYEALYVKFRSMVLLGIMVLAVFGAVQKIATYATGGEVPELVFGPIAIYGIVMVLTCAALACWHFHNWRQCGKRSEILVTEGKAAVIDGMISGGACGGLLASTLLVNTPLAFVVPVADSIVVLVLSVIMVRQPIAMFISSLKQVAGGAAEPRVVDQIEKHLQEFLSDRPFQLVDIAVTKLGRTHFVVAYTNPEQEITGTQADELRTALESSLQQLLGDVLAELVITASPPYQPSK